MNGEQLHDAMNFLDDDLIEETDALRQGRRVIARKPKLIHWLAPAACAALVVGAVSMLPAAMESSRQDSAIFEGILDAEQSHSNGAPESAGQTQNDFVPSWQRISCGAISLDIPSDWDYELIAGTDDAVYICCGTAGEMALRVGFDPAFGVCGTGLREETINIAGMTARAGYYDGRDQWSFAVFAELEPTYVIINEGSESWWSAYGDTARSVLDSIIIDREG